MVNQEQSGSNNFKWRLTPAFILVLIDLNDDECTSAKFDTHQVRHALQEFTQSKRDNVNELRITCYFLQGKRNAPEISTRLGVNSSMLSSSPQVILLIYAGLEVRILLLAIPVGRTYEAASRSEERLSPVNQRYLFCIA